MSAHKTSTTPHARKKGSASHVTNSQQSSHVGQHGKTNRLAEVLDDLCMRFILNLPAEEYKTFERLFFTVESAHWFYEDFYREKDNSLPRLPLKQFAARLFERTALLSPYRAEVDRLTAQFQAYKQEVPTCGAALLNAALDKVVLVRGWGGNGRWGFPKGKLAKDETEIECAIREVEEEIGVDISHLVDGNTYAIDTFVGDRYSRIFVVPDVAEDIKFETRTRKEISHIQWVPIAILPDSARVAKSAGHPSAKNVAKDDRGNKMLFAQHTLAPFTKRLRDWVRRERERRETVVVENSDGTKDDEENDGVVDGGGGTLLTPGQQRDDQPEEERSQPQAVHHNSVPGKEARGATPNNASNATSSTATTTAAAAASTSGSGKKKGGRSKGRGSSGSNGDGSADGKRGGRKGMRKGVSVAENARNRATFGSVEGLPMNDEEREKMFVQYVLKTEREANWQGLQDEFWPVPYVTSEHFSQEERQGAKVGANQKEDDENEALKVESEKGIEENGGGVVPGTGRESCARVVLSENVGRRTREDGESMVSLESFKFDREAIVASMKAVDP